MTDEQDAEIRKLAERDASRAEALGKALDANEARELRMLKTHGSSNREAGIFMVVVASAIASGCGGADPRATCVIAVAAIIGLVVIARKAS